VNFTPKICTRKCPVDPDVSGLHLFRPLLFSLMLQARKEDKIICPKQK